MTKNNLPIGVFDSGLGGLTVVREIIKVLPNEDIVYLGDTARVPYGTRSKEIIQKFSKQDLEFLISKKVKCIVIACHTASSAAGEYLQKTYGKKIKIFEVITPTVEYSKKLQGKTVVLATRATVQSKAFLNKLNSLDIACPLLVPLIEEGETSGELIKLLVHKYLKNIKMENLILGCTHYPIIGNIIRKEVGENINLINPGICTSLVVKSYLTEKGLLNLSSKKGFLNIYVTDENARFKKVTELFLGEKLNYNVQKVIL